MGNVRKMDLVSVIVPVFNAKKYLLACINSVKNQTYENIEIILIDDGSTDGSAELCDELAGNNISVVHKMNEGVSSARNYGLKIAKGKYILFVDADDRVRSDMVFKLVCAIEKSNADIASCRFEKQYRSGRKSVSCKKYRESILANYEALNEMNNEGIISIYVWDKLFKRELIEHIQFPLGVIIGEDYTFNIKAFLNARKIIAIPDILYLYNQNGDSVTHRNFTAKSYATLEHYRDMCNYIITNEPFLALGAGAHLTLQEMAIIVSMIKADKYDYVLINEIKREIRRGLKNYIVNRHVKLYLKCCACMISLCPCLFIWAYKLFFKRARDIQIIEG